MSTARIYPSATAGKEPIFWYSLKLCKISCKHLLTSGHPRG